MHTFTSRERFAGGFRDATRFAASPALLLVPRDGIGRRADSEPLHLGTRGCNATALLVPARERLRHARRGRPDRYLVAASWVYYCSA